MRFLTVIANTAHVSPPTPKSRVYEQADLVATPRDQQRLSLTVTALWCWIEALLFNVDQQHHRKSHRE